MAKPKAGAPTKKANETTASQADNLLQQYQALPLSMQQAFLTAAKTAEVGPLDFYRDDQGTIFTFREHDYAPPTKIPGSPQLVEGLDRGKVTTRSDVIFGQFINSFVRLPPDAIRAYQERLVRAGLLSEGDFTPGYPDDLTISAIGTASKEASVQQTSFDDILIRREQATAELEGAGKTKKQREFREGQETQIKSDFYNTYQSLWGTLPPEGYVESRLSQGLNIFEFKWQETHKPEFENSPVYQISRLGLNESLANRLGTLG